jgi:alpha-L-fucosidase 2
VDIDWNNGKMTKTVIRSRNGGVCHLRSNTPLTGKGLKKTKEANLYVLKTAKGGEYILNSK